jgi:DNA-binding transcriptional MerR regulator/methylmalonyl-CoA mutase cobalamin-binding subunit
MTEPILQTPYGIAAVERDTGLSKDILRVWERRYGFPKPGRDAFGERRYAPDEVDKLRVVRRLMDAGHRPGKLIRLPIADLQALAAESAAAQAGPVPAGADDDELARFIELLKAHRHEELRDRLGQTALRLGLARFAIDVVGPLNALVGEAWSRGELEIFEEHLYTESIQALLRGAIGSIPQMGRSPVVLLTTFPGEPHGLGLLLAETILALEGCRCIPLGVETPLRDTVMAARAHRVDVVALSFTPLLAPGQVVDGLAALRASLPASIGLWVGGRAPVLGRRVPAGVDVLPALEAIRERVERWRASR